LFSRFNPLPSVFSSSHYSTFLSFLPFLIHLLSFVNCVKHPVPFHPRHSTRFHGDETYPIRGTKTHASLVGFEPTNKCSGDKKKRRTGTAHLGRRLRILEVPDSNLFMCRNCPTQSRPYLCDIVSHMKFKLQQFHFYVRVALLQFQN
jgi:hypothetical protein